MSKYINLTYILFQIGIVSLFISNITIDMYVNKLNEMSIYISIRKSYLKQKNLTKFNF